MALVSDLLKLEQGLVSGDYFKRKKKYTMLMESSLDDSVTLECCLSFETCPIYSMDLAYNRLLCGFPLNYITLHDTTPVYKDPYVYPQVGQNFDSYPTLRNVVLYGIECVRWRKYDCGIFTMTGNLPCVVIFDTETVKKIYTIRIPEARMIYQHNYNPLQQHLLGCVAVRKKTHIIDLRISSVSQTLNGSFDSMVSILWSPTNEHRLFTAGSNGELVSWDSRMSRNCLASRTLCDKNTLFLMPELEFDEHGQSLLCLSTDGKLREIDVDSLDSRIIVQNINITTTRRRYHFSVSSLMTPALVFLPNGKNVSIYNLATGEHRKDLVGHTHPVIIVKYNDLNNEVYSVGDDHLFGIWNTKNNKT